MSKITDFGDGAVVEYNYFSFDVNAKYDLNDAYGDTSWFDPYAYTGLVYSYLDGDQKLRGMTLNFGINYQSGIKTGLGDNI